MPFTTPLVRTYIDTRLFPANATEPLPLLDTLPQNTQASVTRFLRPPDRLMSLSSALLKCHFIHTTAKLPWSSITIQRTPRPHSRPYWNPPDSWTSPWASGQGSVEFNVTHQAGMTCLLGCRTPNRNLDLTPLDLSTLSPPPTQGGFGDDPSPRLGLDIACTNERGRNPRDVSNAAELSAWIDVFAEMFSTRERDEMKGPLSRSISGQSTADSSASSATAETRAKLRRFYTSWALKEAFIKLVGEGMLAEWLREVEFLGVRDPSPIAAPTTREEDKWTPPSSAGRDFTTLLRGQRLYVDDVAIEVVAFEADFVVAVATRGVVEAGEEKDRGRWVRLDIERDVRPCAEGRCGCLD